MGFYDLSHPQKERNGLKQMHLYPSPPPLGPELMLPGGWQRIDLNHA